MRALPEARTPSLRSALRDSCVVRRPREVRSHRKQAHGEDCTTQRSDRREECHPEFGFDGEIVDCNVDQAVWQKSSDGRRWTGQAGAMLSDLRCGSLVPILPLSSDGIAKMSTGRSLERPDSMECRNEGPYPGDWSFQQVAAPAPPRAE